MLHRHINQFLDYCQLADFSIRSIQALTARLNEFKNFRKIQRIRSIKRIRYRHLINFSADYNTPSIHVIKSRIWTLSYLSFSIDRFLRRSWRSICKLRITIFTDINFPCIVCRINADYLKITSYRHVLSKNTVLIAPNFATHCGVR